MGTRETDTDNAEGLVPPVPASESARLADLYAASILDTPAEESYDALARTAALVAGVPIGLITLIDEDRQWFKARHGIDEQETTREVAFCAHAIVTPGQPLIVEDATRDPRFKDNPIVVDDPAIRFYCGVPLVSDNGNAYGTLCVVDREPRHLEPQQVEALKGLAEHAGALINARAREREQAAHDDVAHIAVLRAVAEVVEGAATFDEVLRGTLAALVVDLEFAAGGLWRRTGDLLVVDPLWIDPTGAFSAISHAREGLAYGLDVLVHQPEGPTRHGPDVLPTVVAAALAQAGIDASWTVPVIADGDIVASFELIAPPHEPPSAHRLLAASQVAAEAARWFERDTRARELAEAVTHDTIAGVMSRRSIPAYLEHALASIGGVGDSVGGVGVLLIGINRFADIAQSIGPAATDALLVRIVNVLQTALPNGVRLARHSAGELMAMLVGISGLDDLRDAAAAVHAALGEPLPVRDEIVPVSVSIGMAYVPYGGEWHNLLTTAEQALYDARQLGAGTTAAATPRIEDARRRLALKVRIDDAVKDGKIEVHYQPLVRLADDAVVAVEALARWDDPAFGRVPPSEFIEIAEEGPTIGAIGALVRRRALRDLPRLASGSGAPTDFAVWVNVSARELDEQYAAAVLADLALAGVAPEHLTLEVTERLALEPNGVALGVLGDLADAGVHIAVDDFGTGFTSLTQLKTLPLSRIKVDRTFTIDLVGERRARVKPIVQGIVQLGHALGLEIVTEGIETAEHLEAVREIGADLAQGYHLAEPRPVMPA